MEDLSGCAVCAFTIYVVRFSVFLTTSGANACTSGCFLRLFFFYAGHQVVLLGPWQPDFPCAGFFLSLSWLLLCCYAGCCFFRGFLFDGHGSYVVFSYGDDNDSVLGQNQVASRDVNVDFSCAVVSSPCYVCVYGLWRHPIKTTQ